MNERLPHTLRLPPDRFARWVLVGSLILGFAALTVWAFLPVPTLINWIPDDSFYYFQTAAMMARGYIPSFDGVNIGNGFHLLWMAMLVPIFTLKDVNPDLPVHLTLMLAGILYLVAAYLIYKILRLLIGDRLYSAYGAASFVFWPSAVTTAVDGEVTPVNMVVLALLFLNYTHIILSPRTTRRRAIMFGMLAGLAVLARNDNGILLLLLGAHYLTRRRAENKWKSLAWAGGAAAAFVVPWLLWSRIAAGAWWPTSSWAVPEMMHVASGKTGWPAVWTSFKNLTTNVPRLAFYSPLQLGIVFVYGYVVAWFVAAEREGRPKAGVLFVFFAFVFVVYAINIGIRWYMRVWHLGAAFLINHVFLWTAIYVTFGRTKRPRLLAHLAAAAFALFYILDFSFTVANPYYPWQHEMKRGGDWARAHPHLRVGTFNGGLISYYSAGNVVNLDGNMNVAAFRALRGRRLYAYLKEQRVAYIVDYDDWVYKNYGRFFPDRYLSRIVIVDHSLDDPAVGSVCGHSFVIMRVK